MSSTAPRAKFGAAAFDGPPGVLPEIFPRVMGPNAHAYVQEVIDKGLMFDTWSRLESFLADKVGVKCCVSMPGCTPAIHSLAAAMQWDPGDEVIFSPITDYGTCMGFIHENYIPVFADTAPGTVNISAETIEPCITDRTRAIVCVHKTGLLCDMDPIMKLAEKHNLLVLEDACQAEGSTYKGRQAGSLGHVGMFSFDAEKNIGSDIGGALLTNDEQLAERIRFIAQSRGAVAQPGFGRIHTEAGFAYRMTATTAAITLAQVEMWDDIVGRLDTMSRRIVAGLAEISGITPLTVPDYQDTYSCWMMSFSIDPAQFSCSTQQFADQCTEAGIAGAGLGEYYLMPAALKCLETAAREQRYPYSQPPASRSYSYSADNTPRAAAFLKNWIRWSNFCEKYTEEHCDLAVDIVRKVADANRR